MFRLKIALLSVLLSGLVLAGFGYYSLSLLNKVQLDRIDREILSFGEGHLAVGPPRNYWQNFEGALRFIYRGGSPENLIVQIKGPANEVLFKSAQWPPEITERNFPAFERIAEGHASLPVKAEEKGRPPGGPPDSPALAAGSLHPNPDDLARGDRQGPPPEAYQACEGKSPGSRAQFVDQSGVILQGTCENDDGRLVLRPDHPQDERPRRPPAVAETDRPEKLMPRVKKPCLATIQTSSGAWRAGIMGSERITMMVGVNLAGYYEDAARYRNALLAILPVALMLLAGGGWVIAQRALRPVALITRTAEGITARALQQRVPMVDADRELSRLVEVINGMLARLEKSFGQAIRFSADAAHELQTPLAILQGELDAAVQHAPTGSEEQLRYGGLLEEVQRLKVIVQKLLILARADAGRLELRLENLNLSTLIASAAEDASAVAPGLRVETHIHPGVMVKADPDLLGQVIRNLTSNAVKYNQEDGVISLSLSAHDNTARFTIANTGVQISPQDRERIFDRFYRADHARSKTVPGSGLGLSLAREIARAHRGDLRLDPCVGGMVSFTLTLPAAAA